MSPRWNTLNTSEIVPPEELDLDTGVIARLFEATAATTSRHPRCAAQVAVARHGRLAAFRSFGRATIGGVETDATERTLFCVYSCTKAITAAATWILLEDGRLRLEDRVAEHIPEFGTHGKDSVTVEQLLTHTCGFPQAKFHVADWLDPQHRLDRFASWQLAWPAGSRFVYHGTSSMWVVAELITRAAGLDYRDFVHRRIVDAANLPDLFNGLPDSEHSRVADVVSVGKPMSAAKKAVSPVDAPVINEALVQEGNDREGRSIGNPGGGAIASAAGMALFYQAILEDAAGRGPGIWKPEILADAWTARQPELIDPMTQQPALRGLGIVLSGGEDRMWRGFSNLCSPRAFGHMGAGGQASWADPESGLSFVYLTNGADQNAARQGATAFNLSTLAASSPR